MQPPQTSAPSQPLEQKPVCLQSEGRAFVDLLGKSHVLDLLHFFCTIDEPVRFNELKRQLRITATTLSRRLEDLRQQGLISREAYPEVPARVEYALSQRGQTLGPVLESVFGWVDANLV